ncbi:MAG: protoporphyrinogen/coproporphyrinogen oxidase [Solirubrobacteraceae bacterium]
MSVEATVTSRDLDGGRAGGVMPSRAPEVMAVIGGGASGLAAAFRLQQAGYRVKVFDKEPRLGGRMRTLRREGFLIEEGPTQIASSYTSILGIVRDSGMGDQVIPASTSLAMVDRSGQIHSFEVEKMTRDMAKTSLISTREKLALSKIAIETVRHRKKLDTEDLSKMAELDGMSAEQYGRKLLGDNVFDNFVDPVVRGFVGTGPEDVSAACMLYVFGVFMKRQKYMALRDGMSSYPEHLGRLFEVQLEAEVKLAEPKGDEVEVTWRDTDGHDHVERFRGVVIATLPKNAAQIHAGLDSWRRDWLANKVGNATIAEVNLAVDPKPDVSASIIYSTDVSDTTKVLAVGLEHNKVPGRHPDGGGCVVIYGCSAWSRELIAEDDDTIREELIANAQGLLPGVGENVRFSHVTRWPYSWFQSYPGYWRGMQEFRRRSDASDRLIQLAGDYFCTSSLNVASASGERAARTLLTAATTTRRA